MLTTRLIHGGLCSAIVLGLVLAAATPAAGDPWDPDNPCLVDPASVECDEWLDREGGNGGEGGTGEPVCTHRGEEVPCEHPAGHGWWVGDVYGSDQWADGSGNWGPPEDLLGCWGSAMGGPGGNQVPPGAVPPSEDVTEGEWYSLRCIGDRDWPVADLHTRLGWLWESPDSVDPASLALQARAQLDIESPLIRIAPPESGAVPLGMPVWLAVEETPSRFGPLSNTHCDQGLCVWIDARVDRVEWHMGDGESRTCSASENRVWQSGLTFLDPDSHGACSYYYDAPSRDLSDRAYPVEVVAHWRTYWEGGGQEGVLWHEQTVSASITVEEIQVLVSGG